jgi:predicted metal-binding membrane protein
MMLPSFAPRLWRYRRALGRTRQVHLGRLTALAAAGYFAVLSGVGMAAFPLGIALAAIEMQHPALARCVPVAVGVIVMIAGLLQFTAWKARHLACCREDPAHCETAKHRDIARHSGTATVTAGRAWRYGLKLGLHCSCCCGGATAILLAIGVMDLRTMAAVTAAVTFERVMPAGERSARAIGFAVLGVGLFRVLACVHG